MAVRTHEVHRYAENIKNSTDAWMSSHEDWEKNLKMMPFACPRLKLLAPKARKISEACKVFFFKTTKNQELP
jgi:hypothetical protein